MPFLRVAGCRVAVGNRWHRKTCVSESLIDFITDFEGFFRDGRSDDGFDVNRVCSVSDAHLLDGFAGNVCHGTSPTSVYGCDDFYRWVVEQDGNTIGSGYTDAALRKVGDNCINVIEICRFQ